MITCKCPAAASLPDIPAVKCAESFGQIQKVAFQRLTKDDGSKNSFTSEKAIRLLHGRRYWRRMIAQKLLFPRISKPRPTKPEPPEPLEVVTKHWEALRKL